MRAARRTLQIVLTVAYCLSSLLGASSIDFSTLPSTTRSVLFFDLSETQDSEIFQPLQDQLIQAAGGEKDLERFLFLSGLDLSTEAEQLALIEVSTESENIGSVGLVTGRFSEETQHSLDLSQKLMADRSFRVIRLSADQVLFGDQDTVQLYRTNGEKLPANTVEILHRLRSRAPVFGWMTKGWLGDHIPENFSLQPRPEWSTIWARDQILQQSFAATVDDSIDLDFHLEVSDRKAAEILFDELSARFDTMARRGRTEELARTLSEAKLQQDKNRLMLSFSFCEKSLEQFSEWNGFDSLLNGRNLGTNREEWQKVGEIFSASGIETGDQVANVGAGRGFLSVRLARLVGEAGRVWAVDIDAERVEAIQKRAETTPYPQLRPVVGDVDDPHLPEAELDAIFVINAYHEMEEYEEMLCHFRNSLKPGGRLVVVEPWDKDSEDDPREEQVRDHVISPELVQSELRTAGFEIRSRTDEFTESFDESLIVAIRPEGS